MVMDVGTWGIATKIIQKGASGPSPLVPSPLRSLPDFRKNVIVDLYVTLDLDRVAQSDLCSFVSKFSRTIGDNLIRLSQYA